MPVKFTSVAYYILQVTKNKTTWEKKKRQREKKTTTKTKDKKNQWMNNFAI